MRLPILFAMCLLVPSAKALTYAPDANLRAWANSNYPGCVSGNYIDESHPGVMAETMLSINNQPIANLSGLSAFANVTQLWVYGLPITGIQLEEQLPPQLTFLVVDNCPQFTTFTYAPSTVEYLFLRNNALTTLDVSSIYALVELRCSNNQLTTLDFNGWHPTLNWVDCSHNQLTALLDLPSSVYQLIAHHNQLSSLGIPTWCDLLDISYNQFTSLPQVGPQTSLGNLLAHHNQLTTLSGNWTSYMGLLDVSHNQISTVANMIQTRLYRLDVGNNPITSVAALPVMLQELYIDSTTLGCLPYLNKDLEVLRCQGNSFSCLPNQPLQLQMNAANFGFTPGLCDSSAPCYILPPHLMLQVLLQGPFDNGTMLMRDDLRTQGLLPQTEPYTALGFTYSGNGWPDVFDPALLDVTGPDAIVDWVIVDMIPDPVASQRGNAVRYNRPALLQRDGDVVALDGTWPLPLYMNQQGRYVAAVRHRNHLGVVQQFGNWYYADTVAVDYTNISGTSCYPNALYVDPSLPDDRRMWCGDVTFNGQTKYTGVDNDRDPILVAIGGAVPSATVVGVYANADVNMDGVIKYTGQNNDRDLVLQVIGGVNPTAVRTQINLPY
jgi:hypothetical protein